MNILHPTTGQLLDRLTILELKLRAVQRHSPQWEAFRPEYEALVERLNLIDQPTYLSAYKSLYAVNQQLWKEQAAVAAAAALPDPPPNDLGVILFRLNQQRVKLIEEIDLLLGEYRGPEKVYP